MGVLVNLEVTRKLVYVQLDRVPYSQYQKESAFVGIYHGPLPEGINYLKEMKLDISAKEIN